jgi:hypothetical protein
MDREEEAAMRERGRVWAMKAFSRIVFEDGWAESGVLRWVEVVERENRAREGRSRS